MISCFKLKTFLCCFYLKKLKTFILHMFPVLTLLWSSVLSWRLTLSYYYVRSFRTICLALLCLYFQFKRNKYLGVYKLLILSLSPLLLVFISFYGIFFYKLCQQISNLQFVTVLMHVRGGFGPVSKHYFNVLVQSLKHYPW